MADNDLTQRERCVHQIKAWFYQGYLQQDVVVMTREWPYTPKERDELIAEAACQLQEDKDKTEDENREFVMNELKAVYYRACNKEKPDLSTQVSALAQIGKFCGLSEKNPFRGKLVDEEQFTDEDYRKALQS